MNSSRAWAALDVLRLGSSKCRDVVAEYKRSAIDSGWQELPLTPLWNNHSSVSMVYPNFSKTRHAS
jgi:hypothetical protein